MTAKSCSKVGRWMFGKCVSRATMGLMTVVVLLLVVFVGYAAALGAVGTRTPPGPRGLSTPAVPPGHPDIKGLPPGHPDINGLPPGHPDINGLPPGHPRIDGKGGAPKLDRRTRGPVYQL